jgi:hypothetical protein
LISDLSVLGGAEGLSGYEAGRFQDLDLALGELGYIFPIGKNLEIDAHVEVGGVFPDLEAARSDQLKKSYGTMLRVRGDRSLICEVGVEWSREQTRFRFSFGGEQ